MNRTRQHTIPGLGLAFATILALGCQSPETSSQTEAESKTVSQNDLQQSRGRPAAETGGFIVADSAQKTDQDWRQVLTPEEYAVMRRRGTERAFAGKYWDTKAPGVYHCAACDFDLFDSDHKYDSGSGWPSYWRPIADDRVRTAVDSSADMIRTEALCNRCGAHLGHIFSDGPPPTGLRYCLNSVSLSLVERQEGEAEPDPPSTE